jgi:hypothetical protein
MNIYKTFIVYLTVAAIAILPAASAIDRDGFCQDLTALDAHMNAELDAVIDHDGYLSTSRFECACVDSGMAANTLTVDCMEKNDDEYFSVERIVFKLEGGKYSLGHTFWGGVDPETGEVGIRDEVFDWDDGAITSCKGNTCKSCNVCEDGVSVKFACTPSSEVYNTTCSEGYTGSFSHTFDFGVITGEEVHGDTILHDPIPGSPVDQEAFCRSLAPLESHMNDSSENMLEMTLTTSFECSCSEIDMNDKSFMVDCTMEGSTGETPFVDVEHLLFKVNDGSYELARASWSWEEPGGIQVVQPEVFYLDDGVVTGCDIAGWCSSCSLCEDGQSIEIACGPEQGDAASFNQDCSNGYTGAFAMTFDFGAINQPTTKSTTTPTTIAATGSTTATQATDAGMATTSNETTAADTDTANSGTTATTQEAKATMATTLNQVTTTSAEATSALDAVSENKDEEEEEKEIAEAVGASNAGAFLHATGWLALLAFVRCLIGMP